MRRSRLFIGLLPLVFLVLSEPLVAQEWGSVQGLVTTGGEPHYLATISISTDPIVGETSGIDGKFTLDSIPLGSYQITVSYVGYQTYESTIVLDSNNPSVYLTIELEQDLNVFDDIVVTGTKTFKRKTNSPVIVHVLNKEKMEQVQACNLSEGLRFQPGLRVETDCQTCNYTQLRMNGLAGGYSQILINGRPIFSPLTGLYGLEQLPTNMIERIEVIRGGGSSLYGSSAIGGTVNVITKIPKGNTYEIDFNNQWINRGSNDFQARANASVMNETETLGATFFINYRDRMMYDHNGDSFSELPELNNLSVGSNLVYIPNDNQKLEFSLSQLSEYRYGGEMIDAPAFQTAQSEEREHRVTMGSFDHQINFNNQNTALISYAAFQHTDRSHYTGIFPDEDAAVLEHLMNPPYGSSITTTWQAGMQLNHRIEHFILGSQTLTLGSEYMYDDVYDIIPSYEFLVDQVTHNYGLFIQSDWQFSRAVSLLSGVRFDKHNLVDQLVVNPRVSLLYKYLDNTQFRLSYGSGFRAPQAFDADLHIAFAGGGISRIIISPDLQAEHSQSLSASVNYDKPTEHYVYGFTAEGFYTYLDDVFILNPIDNDSLGNLFEKTNGAGARVMGVTMELRANYDKKMQVEAGLTYQSSQYDAEVKYIDELDGLKAFVRTPDYYGFATIFYKATEAVRADLNYVYTGSMLVPHFAGAVNQSVDEIIESRPFSDLSCKISYIHSLPDVGGDLVLYGGVKNIFNAYQNDFDIGKNRDSNFIYGPSLPRTFYLGLKIKVQ